MDESPLSPPLSGLTCVTADCRAALVIAHPGHELRVHGWLEAVRPRVSVLTDGSGSVGRSRLASTSRILGAVGLPRSSLFGRFTDRAIYAAIMEGRYLLFTQAIDELASDFVQDHINFVAGDASEGYNSTHDACRMMIDAAVAIVGRTSGMQIANYEFALTSVVSSTTTPGCAQEPCPQDLRIHLSTAAITRKVAAAQSYTELAAEVEAALKLEPVNWCSEHLHLRDDAPPLTELDDTPHYERYGEQQVAAGKYHAVLRYRDHMLPLQDAIRRHVEKAG